MVDIFNKLTNHYYDAFLANKKLSKTGKWVVYDDKTMVKYYSLTGNVEPDIFQPHQYAAVYNPEKQNEFPIYRGEIVFTSNYEDYRKYQSDKHYNLIQVPKAIHEFLYHGSGTIYDGHLKKFIGGFSMGKKNGFGIELLDDVIYMGYYKDDEKYGLGLWIFEDVVQIQIINDVIRQTKYDINMDLFSLVDFAEFYKMVMDYEEGIISERIPEVLLQEQKIISNYSLHSRKKQPLMIRRIN